MTQNLIFASGSADALHLAENDRRFMVGDIETLVNNGELQRLPCAACGRPLYLPADFSVPRDGMLCGTGCEPRLPGLYLCYPTPNPGDSHDKHNCI